MKDKELLKKANVVLVGKGKKIVHGADTGRDAVVVGVIKKLPATRLNARDIVPKVIEGMETDVIEVGEIKLLGVSEEDRAKRWRPAPGGVSIGHRDITAGTLGAVVKKNGERYLLSNNHVFANMNAGEIGDPIYQPGPHDGGTSDDTIATLREFVKIETLTESLCPVCRFIANATNFWSKKLHRKTRLIPTVQADNLVDCAIAKPVSDGDVSDEVLEIGIISGVAEPEIGMVVQKSGRTSGLTKGKVSIIDATVMVSMGGYNVANFVDQFAIDLISQGGDSGSTILTEDKKIVGLLFAGGDTITISNRWENIQKMLRIEI